MIKECNCLCVENSIGGAVSKSVGEGRPELSGDTFRNGKALKRAKGRKVCGVCPQGGACAGL